MIITPPPDFKLLIENTPGLIMVLLPDFTILTASNDYLKATLTDRNNITGRPLFEVFPDNPNDVNANGVSNLRASLELVLQTGKAHEMAIQRYDVRDHEGKFIEKYWAPVNTPVFNNYHEIVYIIHKAEDVTNIQKVSAELKKNELNYRMLVDGVKDYAIFMIDQNGRVATWNEGAEKIKGFQAAEVIGKPIDIFYTPEDIKMGVPNNNLLIAKQTGRFESDGWCRKKDGSLLCLNTVITALKDEQGKFYGYSKIIQDITERVRAQEQLESLSKMVNQSNDAIYIVDNTFKIKTWNLGAKRLYGYNEDEVIGKDSNTVLNTQLDRKEIIKLVEKINITDYWSGELIRKTKSGESIWVRSSSTPVRDNNGNITGYVAVSMDITAQKRLQQEVRHLANIVEQSSEAIISRDIYDNVISWNKGAEILFGINKADAIGKSINDLGITRLTPQDLKAVTQHIIDLGGWQHENILYHKDGSSFHASITANPVKDDHGEVTSLVVIIKDISLRKKWEDYLQRSNSNLEETVRQRTIEIKRSEEKYLNLFNNNPLPIWVLDINTQHFLAVNEMAIKKYGYSREEFMTMSAADIRPEEDRELFLHLRRPAVNEDENPNKGIWRHLKKDGSMIFVEIIAHHIFYEGKPARIILANDVTAKKQAEDLLKVSENRFRALIENSDDIITLMDNSFDILYRSPAAARITGWSNEDMMGMDATTNIHPDDRAYAQSVVKEVMSSPNKPVYTKFRMIHKKGHHLFVEGTLTNFLSDQYVKAIVFNFRDITHRVDAEQKLINSEKQFRSTLDNMLEGIQIINFSWEYIYINQSLLKMSKYSREELIGHTVMEKYPGIEQTALFATLRRCMEHRVSEQFEDDFIYPDGSKASFEFSIQPVPEGLFVLSIDVTEKKRIKEQLMVREQQLELFIQHSPVALAMFDNDMKYIAASERWINDYGLNRKELTGKNNQEHLPLLPAHWKEVYLRCINGAVEENQNDSFISEDGRQSWLRWKARPWHQAYGEIGGVIIFTEDITEIKLAEQQKEFDSNNLKALINNTRDLMWSVDRSFRLITCNDAFCEAIEVNTGKPIEKSINILTTQFTEEKFEQYKGHYERAFSGEIFTITDYFNGPEPLWAEISFYPIAQNGAIIGTACFSKDITQKREAEEAIKKSNERFELVVTATNDVIWDWDMNTNTFWRNKNYYSHFGYDEKNIAADPTAWHDGIYPNDKKRVLAGVDKSIKNKENFWKDEYRYLKADHSLAFVLDCGYILYDENKKPYRMVGAMLDITDRKIAEQALKKTLEEKQALAERMSVILNTLPANIALLNDKGVIIEVNDSWRMFASENEYAHNECGIGLNYIEICRKATGKDKKQGEAVAKGIEAVIKKRQTEFVLEYPCHSPTRDRWFRMIVSPLHHATYSGAVVMHIDISEVHRLEQERLQLKTEEQIKMTQAMLLGQEKERNAIGIELHDNVNQILAGTRLMLSMSVKDPSKHEKLIHSCLENIQHAIDENRKIAHELVAPDLENVPFVEQLTIVTNNMLRISGIAVEIHAKGFREDLLNNQRLLSAYRIVQEQCSNIAKYAQAKKVTIDLTTAEDLFTMKITDDGKGMEPGKIITGIGLKNIKSRLTIFNGSVAIHTAPGKGFQLELSIPY